MRIFLLLALTLQLFAVDMVDIYRKQGLAALKDILESELRTQEYWQKYLQWFDTDLGYYENTRFVIVTDKSKPDFSLYEMKDNTYALHSSMPAIVGKAQGDKQIEGDLKTPVGIYMLKSKLKDLDPKYGPLAYNTSFPNLMDQLRGKNGHGIWIHGLPENDPEKPDTEGCIAIDNTYLSSLESFLDYQKTLLIISENAMQFASKDELALIMSSLFQWKEAWRTSDIETYLSFYDPGFMRFDGQKIDTFSRMKRRIFARKQKKFIKFENFDVAPYPTLDGTRLYLVRFFETYKTKTYTFEGWKELYVKLDNGRFSILIEK